MVEFVEEALRFLTLVCFFLSIQAFYGLPLHLIRRIIVSFRSFQRRFNSLRDYYRIVRNIHSLFPPATPEEIQENPMCLVCRDDLHEAVKLPCGHLFHFVCLYEWLNRSHECPTCRRSLLEPQAHPQPQQPPQPIPQQQPFPQPPHQPHAHQQYLPPQNIQAQPPQAQQFHPQVPQQHGQFQFSSQPQTPPAFPNNSQGNNQQVSQSAPIQRGGFAFSPAPSPISTSQNLSTSGFSTSPSLNDLSNEQIDDMLNNLQQNTNLLHDQVTCVLQILQDTQQQIGDLKQVLNQRSSFQNARSMFDSNFLEESGGLTIPEESDETEEVKNEPEEENFENRKDEKIPPSATEAIRQRRLMRFSNPAI